jgi:hypothetical protein
LDRTATPVRTAKLNSRVVAISGFFICLVLWLAFAAGMVAGGGIIYGSWHWFRAQPLVAEGLIGLVLLPWAIGLAIWESRWPMLVRLLIVGGLVYVNLYSFFTWRSALVSKVRG